MAGNHPPEARLNRIAFDLFTAVNGHTEVTSSPPQNIETIRTQVYVVLTETAQHEVSSLLEQCNVGDLQKLRAIAENKQREPDMVSFAKWRNLVLLILRLESQKLSQEALRDETPITFKTTCDNGTGMRNAPTPNTD
ncbi:MAG TPA: hypothetical protein VI913_04355 [Candidatus Peribacteraceae bacterium]|nr:hypothetical protein [Candidatus Peribacteraceae bacterium]